MGEDCRKKAVGKGDCQACWGWYMSFPLTGKGGTVMKIIEQEV